MDLIEKYKNQIEQLNNNQWYFLRIAQNITPDHHDFRGIDQFRVMVNSSKSIGISNREFSRRYIYLGFWINLRSYNKDEMMIFFQSRKKDLSSFERHYRIRYHHASGLRPDELKFSCIKPENHESAYQIMDNLINKEIDRAIENGYDPDIRMSRFGAMHSANKV